MSLHTRSHAHNSLKVNNKAFEVKFKVVSTLCRKFLSHIAMEFKLETLQMSWAQTSCDCVCVHLLCYNANVEWAVFGSENTDWNVCALMIKWNVCDDIHAEKQCGNKIILTMTAKDFECFQLSAAGGAMKCGCVVRCACTCESDCCCCGGDDVFLWFFSVIYVPKAIIRIEFYELIGSFSDNIAWSTNWIFMPINPVQAGGKNHLHRYTLNWFFQIINDYNMIGWFLFVPNSTHSFTHIHAHSFTETNTHKCSHWKVVVEY